MNLEKKKTLAAKTFNVGRERVIFNTERISEIKEAITRQDLRDLLMNNAISIRDVHGRKSKEKRKTRRRGGSVRKKVNRSKQDYVILTRKLRRYVKELKGQEKINDEQYIKLRKQIRASNFKSKSHLKENIQNVK